MPGAVGIGLQMLPTDGRPRPLQTVNASPRKQEPCLAHMVKERGPQKPGQTWGRAAAWGSQADAGAALPGWGVRGAAVEREWAFLLAPSPA